MYICHPKQPVGGADSLSGSLKGMGKQQFAFKFT